MQPMWCYAGNPVDLDGTNWCITVVDTFAKDSLNSEALHKCQDQRLEVEPHSIILISS